MNQERLSSLNILSIENETVNALRYDLDAVMEIFSKSKSGIRHIEVFFRGLRFFTD